MFELVAALSFAIVMVPLWRITRRTGRDPWLSVFFLINPAVGLLLLMGILAFGRWPAAERATPPGTGPTEP
ncbi:MAG TPA: hypothetical protein VEA81_14825 [Burkholderiaceae bacterium]|nr:hypothetical protein [Burkholderiaceae bacterium]